LAVGKLRYHESANISALANEIVEKWKAIITQERIAARHRDARQGDMTIPCMFRRIECPVSNGADIQTHHISQSVRTDDETRNTWIELVCSGLQLWRSIAADLIFLKAVEIERAVHDYSGSTWPYQTAMRALFWHLSDE
ncbi:hypothetical protein B0H14DRAFT_2165145, partial [Mycena olivaceomarginata]